MAGNYVKKKRNRILIVDDQQLNLKVLNKILCPEYSIRMINSGALALDIVNKYLPDLILLDIMMPDMNGFDVLLALKASEKTRKIPVIIITGLDNVEDEEKGLALDAADFIHKPFSSKVVKSRVHNQIQIVNQIKELEEYAQIQATLAAAEEKSKFFAKMSHEMRTPLNAVIGLSELILEDEKLSDEIHENVEKICNSGSSLLCLVNDILDISKMEERKFYLVPVEYDTARMINDTVSQSITHRKDKTVEFILSIENDFPARLFGDDLRIRQVFNNLLSNAFKYTKEGSVELIISAVRNDAKYLLCASVKDTGIGLPPGSAEKIFAEFTQIDLFSNREIKGTGLGLSISKMIVDMMGGTISVESEYGKGSVFTVNIPQTFVSDEMLHPDVIDNLKHFHYSSRKHKSRTRLSRISLPYARILIVDDVPINLDVARGMMKPYRMHIDCALSGQEAVNAIKNENIKYNAVFMDHMMPVMDGIEATRIIREEIGTDYAKKIPIIAFTANAFAVNEEMFLSKGFNAFISKPIDIIRLDAVLRQWVRDEEIEKSITDQYNGMESETGDRRQGRGDRRKGDRRVLAEKITGVDIGKGLDRFSGDWETFLQIIKTFPVNLRPVIDSIRTVNRENLRDYAIIVHGIKSACRGICAEQAGNQAEALEFAAKTGDLEYVQENNQAFINIISKIIMNIDDVFKDDKAAVKQKKEKPYAEALSDLKTACQRCAIEEIEKTMNEIEAFDYASDNGLVLWLRDNVNQMNYSEIAGKISLLI